MDTTAPDISFDGDGVCNFCSEFLARADGVLNQNADSRASGRDALVADIKRHGAGRRYDCVVGVSGGVDSSWALLQAVKLGLRPLAVHMDNGWNSELAQNNIENLVQKLGVDLYTHVIDWPEYRALMQAFFDADVIDVELLYDNAMLALNYRLAREHGLRHILAGSNQSTEGIHMPSGWNWLKFDKRNIKGIARSGGARLKTFPAMGTLDYLRYRFLHRTQWVSFLDYFEYNKAAALEELQRDYAYKPYPFKHYESVFTRFYQGYLLPEKFGVDKRRLHLSTLVATGQMSRGEALAMLEGIAYASTEALADDVRYFLKKMGWSQADLDDYLARAPRAHDEFPSERFLWDWLLRAYQRR